jgi:PAS domain S-box-containing protein
MLSPPSPEAVIDGSLAALDGDDWRLVLEGIDAPVYLTDPSGWLTFANRPAVELAGREPEIGKDRWCVSWKLHTQEGEPLPHARCPMARALAEQRPIRDAVVIAERPDGTRAACRVYPTPVQDGTGTLVAGLNLLIDITPEQKLGLSEQAARCRRLARATHDASASAILTSMATGYDATAKSLAE